MTLFGQPALAIFLIAGGVLNVLLAYVLAPRLRKHGAVIREKWRSVPAKILSSRIVEEEGEDGPLYSAEIRYEYTVDGTRYESDRINLFPKWSSSRRERSEKIIAEFPVGRECSGWVHPSKTSQSVLSPEALPPMAAQLFFIILAGTGVLLVLGGACAWIFRIGTPL